MGCLDNGILCFFPNLVRAKIHQSLIDSLEDKFLLDHLVNPSSTNNVYRKLPNTGVVVNLIFFAAAIARMKSILTMS